MAMKLPNQQLQEPVAIIGVGCRLPGASGLESFWPVLRDGVDAVGDYPGGRFEALDRFYETQPGRNAGPPTRRGGFLQDVDSFDADFFGISPREAILLDPQHRLLLELASEALDDAGLPLPDIAGSQTGVFIGQWTSDFETCVHEMLREPQFYSTTGTGRYAAAGRLAYQFDLRGTVLTLDTACSSSLVAVHLACETLRSGESALALAGAVNLIFRSEVTRVYGAAGMLSPDGRCKFGDSSADGYVRSEAGAVVVLKLLSRALADGDPVHAVIRGSSISNDGRSSGMLVSPSRDGQAAMMRAALRSAGISAAELDYVEAHGTGTAAGDPVEIEAIGSVLADLPRERPCLVGSVKTNVGHTEAAAGMAGLCKLILSLRHGVIPASLNFRDPSPAIPWQRLPLTIPANTRPWPHSGKRRLAGISSIGITGTNAHLILENAPEPAAPSRDAPHPRLFVLSARSPAALEQAAVSWRARLRDDPSWPSSMEDLAYTASVRRTAHPFRLAAVAASARDLDAQLQSWIEHGPADLVRSGHAPAQPPGVVFVFPGQGGQWAGMGRELFALQPVFRDAITRCDHALRAHTGWSVIDEILSPSAASAADVDRVQPVLFAMMVALAALWRSWGVEPEAVVGHSMGEAAAAVVCGALSLEDGAAVIAHRSRLMKTASGRGLMAMAALTLADARELIQPYGGRISVAANNSPASTVLSGDADAVEEVIAILSAREIFCRRIQVDVASHCSHMNPLAPQLEQQLHSIMPRLGRIPLYSTSSGQLEDGLALGPAYWGRNLREPVLFADAVQSLLRDGFAAFLEINPHPVLLHAIGEGAAQAGREILTLASLRRDHEELPQLLASLGQLHVSGYPVRFSSLYPAGRCLRLPAYPWQRERYWPEPDQPENRRLASRGPHPSLGAPVESSLHPGVWLFDLEFRPPADPLQSAAWSLDLVISGARAVLSASSLALEEIRFADSSELSGPGQLAIFRDSDGVTRFRLSVRPDDRWIIGCEGRVHPAAGEPDTHLPAEGSPVSDLPLRACLRAAAQALGCTEEDAGWTVSRIASIHCSEAEISAPLGIRTASARLDAASAHAAITTESGAPLLHMTGVRLDLQGIANCARHIYQWTWAPVEPASAHPSSPGVVVIAGDPVRAEQIAARFSAGNAESVIASDPHAVRSLIESLGPLCKAVLWVSAECASEPASALQQGSALLSLVQAIIAANSLHPPSLWLITSGAQSIEDAPGHPVAAAQSALWGMARVIARERPEIRCAAIDLSPEPGTQDFDQLVRLADGAVPREHLALRGEKWYGLRLARHPTHPPSLHLSGDAAYLITGGCGELGLSLAEFLAERGARHIALVGRRSPGEAARRRMATLENRGVQLRAFQADVAEHSPVAAVLASIQAEMGPLKGVFHLAGITQDALLEDLTHESLERVMRPKVWGAWNLHCLTAAAALDHFVLYSSLAAVSSQPGQAGYAAANAYMDGLARFRRASGLPAISMQWGAWDNAGMIRESGASRSLLSWAEQGIGALRTETALDGVHRLMAQPVAVAFLAAVDWKRFARNAADKASPLFSSLVEPAADAPRTQVDLRDQLAALPPAERISALQEHLKNAVAAVLKSKASRIDSSARFAAIGVDSLMAVEIARRLTETLQLRLPVTAIFNFPTSELLAAEIARRMDLDSSPRASTPAAAAAAKPSTLQSALPSIAAMSEEEALRSLVNVEAP